MHEKDRVFRAKLSTELPDGEEDSEMDQGWRTTDIEADAGADGGEAAPALSPEEQGEEAGGDGDAEERGAQASLGPFLPGTKIQYAWDSTSLDWFKRCPRLYQYQMIEGWRPPDESVHLRYGIEVHEAFHSYDKLRAADINHEDALLDVVRGCIIATAEWNSEDKYKNRLNLLRAVVGYLDHYDPDPAETIIMGGGEPACEINFKFELDWGPNETLIKSSDSETGFDQKQPYVLCGYLDRVVNFNSEVFTMDRKTTKTTPGAYFFNQFEPNNQMSLYTLAGKVIFGTSLKGVIIDAIQVGTDFTREVRSFTYRTKEQLDEWLDDLRLHLEEAEKYAEEDYWPMRETSCDKYGGCPFREVCSKSPNVRHVYLKSNFVQLPPEERWNPLKPRE